MDRDESQSLYKRDGICSHLSYLKLQIIPNYHQDVVKALLLQLRKPG